MMHNRRVPVAQLDRAPASEAGCRWFESTQARHLFYLFLLAFSVRLLYLYQVGQSPFFFPPLGLDPSLYHHWADSIASGKGMGKEVFQAMPLYPYFLGLIYKVSIPGLFWAKFIQLLMGAVNVLFVYQIGKSLFNPAVGWIAALGQSFSGISIFYEELLVPAALVSFLLILTFFCLLRAAKKNTLREWLGVGIFLGFTTLAQAGVLLFLPFLFFWMIQRPAPLLRKCAAIGIVFGCVLLAVSAVLLRNLNVAQDPVLLTAHGGINFYIGNHAGANGRFESLFSKHTSSEQLLQESKAAAEKEMGRTLKAGEASQFWFRKGLDFIRTDPGQYLKLLSKKFLLFWNASEIPDVEDYYFFRSRFPVLKYLGIPLGWLIPFGLLGMAVGFREFRKLALLYGFFLTQILAILLVFVNSRYRAPLAFLVCLFAAAGIQWCYHLFTAKRYRTLVITFFVLLHILVLTQFKIGAADEGLQHYNVGVVLDNAGEHDAAIQEFTQALWVDPEDGTLLFALANAHFRKGDFEEARKRYEEVLRVVPNHADACFNLGLLYFHEGRLGKAEDSFEKSVVLKSDQPDVHYLLSVIYRKKGLLQKAAEAKARALALGADPAVLEKDPDRMFVR